jgi:steroid delta-isomerase-like uncharacterized protein
MSTSTATTGSIGTSDQVRLGELKELVVKWVDVVNSGTVEGIESVWAQDCVVRPGGGLPEVHGVTNLAGLLTAYRDALADMQITTESLVAEGDLVAARFTTRGRHDGEFLGIPATGVAIEIGGFGLFRIANGLIVEEWLLDDLAAFMNQVNPLPTSAVTGARS